MKDKIKISVLTDYQREALELHYQLGAITGICINLNNDFTLYHILCGDYVKNSGMNNILLKDLKEYKVRFNGAVNF